MSPSFINLFNHSVVASITEVDVVRFTPASSDAFWRHRRRSEASRRCDRLPRARAAWGCDRRRRARATSSSSRLNFEGGAIHGRIFIGTLMTLSIYAHVVLELAGNLLAELLAEIPIALLAEIFLLLAKNSRNFKPFCWFLRNIRIIRIIRKPDFFFQNFTLRTIISKKVNTKKP